MFGTYDTRSRGNTLSLFLGLLDHKFVGMYSRYVLLHRHWSMCEDPYVWCKMLFLLLLIKTLDFSTISRAKKLNKLCI